MILKSPNDSYVLDPAKAELVLRSNGKFGSTYLGKRVSDSITVVIKKLNPALAGEVKALTRFKRESALKLDHPGLVKVFEYFIFENDHYLVREFFPGTDLRALPGKRKLNAREIVEAAIKVCDALSYIHQFGIVHRDIRPANIIVGDGGVIKLIDLGLAKFPGDDPSEKNPFALIYSPPEQVMNCSEAVNPTSDIYALAISIYECITGKIPFQHGNPEMMMQLMLNMPLEKDRKVPAALLEVLARASSKYHFPLPPNKYKRSELVELMLKGQETRYKTAMEFGAALKEVLPGLNKGGFLKRVFRGK